MGHACFARPLPTHKSLGDLLKLLSNNTVAFKEYVLSKDVRVKIFYNTYFFHIFATVR